MAYAEYLKTQGSPGIAVQIGVEADEFWSYVGKKSEQRWTWYAIDHEQGIVLAHHNGKRTDAACQALLAKLARFPIQRYYTDTWQSYAKFIPPKKHQIGKDETWRIERKNLNFRTHVSRLHRKTIGFSKDSEIHDKVIGLYIERHYYQKHYSKYHMKNI